MTPADNIAFEMRQAAQNFNHRPKSMRGSAFAGLLTSFQTASTPDNILAILDDRDALKARVAELESLLAYVRQSEHRFPRSLHCNCKWCKEDRDFVRRVRAAVPETTKSPPASDGERAR